MPPLVQNPDENKKYFAKIYKLYVDNQKKVSHNHFNVLSAGSSCDYTAAIEEGATIVRLGTVLFGTRA
jgi:uncharacterized pyridoxal phosphate-containing UPF0001 family protein